MTSRAVGVVGAGTIGRGVAHAFAAAGWDVRLVDISQAQLDSALDQIAGDLRMFALYARAPANPDAVLSRITVSTDLASLDTADLIIENVTEDWEVKQPVYRQLDAICCPGVVFGVNTSAIPIAKIAAVTARPDRVIGIHFMNPVPIMDTVEVMRGQCTSEGTVAFAQELIAGLGKTAVVVGDAPGFVANRVLMLTINEAICCVDEQVATPEQVDQIFRGCIGFKMGPLETADLIGLDTVLNSISGIYDAFKDSKFRPSPLLLRMVDAGLFGCKSGRGFYNY
jgi:3-hydroxybutyryl-CoA dehydrogenase